MREAFSDEGDVRPVGEALDRVLARLRRPPVEATRRLVEDWEQIVGPEVAALARPAELADGVLVLDTSDPAAAEHLRWASAELVKAVNDRVGTGVVREVRVRVRASPEW